MYLQETFEKLRVKDYNVTQRVYKHYILKNDTEMNERIKKAKENLDVTRTFNILKESFDNALALPLFEEPFDDEYVLRVLQNDAYICFLIKSHMINRVYKLEEKRYSAFLIRFYLSILNFR